MKPLVFARLVRIEHALMLCVAVLVGEVIVFGGMPPWQLVLLSFFPPFFIEMSAFAINDFFDVEVDRANNRKDRPLVTGEATMEEVLAAAVICGVIGVVAAWFINFVCFGIALLFCGLAFLYSYKLKDLPLLGNVYIAFTMAIPFLFGSFAITPYAISQRILLMIAIAFLTGLGREVLGTVRDIEGDKLRGSRTLPMVIGKQFSLYFSSLMFVVAVLLSIIPFILLTGYKNDFNYLLTVGICDSLLIYIAARAPGAPQVFLEEARRLSLTAMGFGLLAFLLGAYY